MADKPHLLMVDDNGGDLGLVRIALDDARIDVAFDTAADGLHGQALLQRLVEDGQTLPKVILLDLNMPRMDGRRLLVWIRSSEVYRALPVIVFTSSHDAKERTVCMAMGATDYWAKPSTLEGYSQLVAHLVPYLTAT